jgi:hypothetical protein
VKATRGIALAAVIQSATAVGVVVCLQAGGPSPTALGTVPLAAATPPPVRTVPVVQRKKARPPTPVRKLRHASTPTGLQLERLAITAPVVPVTMDAVGALGVPSDVHEVGWWRQSAQPGSAHGTVVIDGHVDSSTQGRGSLFPLRDAIPGDVITVSTRDGVMTYVVAARRTYAKPDLPMETFSKKGQPRLVVITCGGKFDRATHHYESNVVVYALPATGQ